MADYGKYFIGCQNLHHAHLDEVGVLRIPADHVNSTAFG
jgi:hypothetical protein